MKPNEPRQLQLPFDDGIPWRSPVGQFFMHGILKMALGREPTESELLANTSRWQRKPAAIR
jgi:hypothetical protein